MKKIIVLCALASPLVVLSILGKLPVFYGKIYDAEQDYLKTKNRAAFESVLKKIRSKEGKRSWLGFLEGGGKAIGFLSHVLWRLPEPEKQKIMFEFLRTFSWDDDERASLGKNFWNSVSPALGKGSLDFDLSPEAIPLVADFVYSYLKKEGKQSDSSLTSQKDALVLQKKQAVLSSEKKERLNRRQELIDFYDALIARFRFDQKFLEKTRKENSLLWQAYLANFPFELEKPNHTKQAEFMYVLKKFKWSEVDRENLLEKFTERWLTRFEYLPSHLDPRYVDALADFFVSCSADQEFAFDIVMYQERIKTVEQLFETDREKNYEKLQGFSVVEKILRKTLEKIPSQMKTNRALPNLCKEFGCDKNKVWSLEEWRAYTRDLFEKEFKKRMGEEAYEKMKGINQERRAISDLASALSELAGT